MGLSSLKIMVSYAKLLRRTIFTKKIHIPLVWMEATMIDYYPYLIPAYGIQETIYSHFKKKDIYKDLVIRSQDKIYKTYSAYPLDERVLFYSYGLSIAYKLKEPFYKYLNR